MWISEIGTSNKLRTCHPLSVRIGSCLPIYNFKWALSASGNTTDLHSVIASSTLAGSTIYCRLIQFPNTYIQNEKRYRKANASS